MLLTLYLTSLFLENIARLESIGQNWVHCWPDLYTRDGSFTLFLPYCTVSKYFENSTEYNKYKQSIVRLGKHLYTQTITTQAIKFVRTNELRR